MKRLVTVAALVVFAAASTVFAAEPPAAAEKQWYLSKDKREVCSCRQQKKPSAKTIAGPFQSREEAQAEKANPAHGCKPSKGRTKAAAVAN